MCLERYLGTLLRVGIGHHELHSHVMAKARRLSVAIIPADLPRLEVRGTFAINLDRRRLVRLYLIRLKKGRHAHTKPIVCSSVLDSCEQGRHDTSEQSRDCVETELTSAGQLLRTRKSHPYGAHIGKGGGLCRQSPPQQPHPPRAKEPLWLSCIEASAWTKPI